MSVRLGWTGRVAIDEWFTGSLFRSDSEALPDSGLFKVARGVEFLEFIGRSGPSQTIVSVACESAVRHRNRHAEGRGQEHVSNAVEDNQTLCHHRERSWCEVSPADASSVQGCAHNEVAQSKFFHDIANSWGINLDGEGWALISAIQLLGVVSSPDHSEWAEWAPSRAAIRLHNVSTVVLFLQRFKFVSQLDAQYLPLLLNW